MDHSSAIDQSLAEERIVPGQVSFYVEKYLAGTKKAVHIKRCFNVRR